MAAAGCAGVPAGAYGAGGAEKVANDDRDAFKVCIESLKLYCHSYLHFMGANLHNIL